jgi:hypothetical protein
VVRFTPRPLYSGRKTPDTHWIGGWLGLRVGLDDLEKKKFLTLPGLGTLTPRLCNAIVCSDVKNEVLKVATVMSTSFWGVMQCSLIECSLSIFTVEESR